MSIQKVTQEQQVIEVLRDAGGYATLRRLNELLDFSTWATKTPEASVRRIVQNSSQIFKVQPGLWALNEMRDVVLQRFELNLGNKKSEEQFSHGYYQGLLVEIGKFRRLTTYVPAQDQNRLFIDKKLGEITDTTELPNFTNDILKRRARTIDVIWFNERNMPSDFYEVEHTTDIKNSLTKFYELQDFNAGFYIVADSSRKKEYEDKLHVSMFSPIEKRVKFLNYKQVVDLYEGLKKVDGSIW
jgi:hypothetical protein